MASAERLRVGDWLVCPDLNRVTRSNKTVQVEPRVMETLVYLARRPGQVISRNELLDALWGEAVVVEAALTRAVSELRTALGDDPKAPRYIETIRKSGYRLIAEVVEEGDGPAIAAPSASASPRSRTLLAGLAGIGLAGIAVVSFVPRLRGPEAPDPAGGPSPIPLTTFPGAEMSPALSPDGARVAFLWSGGTESGAFDLWVKQRGAETPLRLTETPQSEGFPVWSPDGGEVAFARHLPEGQGGIFAVPAIGGEPRRVATIESWPLGLDWSPDGLWLTYAAVDGPRRPDRIYRLELDTLERRPLTDPDPATVGDTLPCISPDGRAIAFVRGDRLAFQDVFLIPAGGGEPRRLTRGHRRIHGIAWDRGGRSVLVCSIPRGDPVIWRVSLEDGATSRIALAGVAPAGVATARESDAFVFAEGRSETDIWAVRAGADAPAAPIVASTRWDGAPSLAPGGERIAFLSDRSGAAEVWTCRADGTSPLRLTSLAGPSVRNLVWSPDGERIAFTATEDGRSVVHVMPSEGGVPSPVTAGEHRDVSSGWSSDGEWIYFDSDRTGEWQVWKIPAEGGDAIQVTRNGGLSGRESADGQRLFYVKIGSPGIWAIPLEGGEEETVAHYHSIGDCGNWIPVDGGVVFATWDRTGPVIARHDFHTGEVRRIVPAPGITMSSLDAAPDGGLFLWARTEVPAVDLLLVESLP